MTLKERIERVVSDKPSTWREEAEDYERNKELYNMNAWYATRCITYMDEVAELKERITSLYGIIDTLLMDHP